MRKRKARDRSPSTQSVQTSSTQPEPKPKIDKPSKKRSKCQQTPPSQERTADLVPPPSKTSTSQVKSEPGVSVKEGSTTTGKAPVCARTRKGAKVPIVEVLTICWKKGDTPPPTIISEDTHADPWGRSPTPITVELMLDRIFTDLPLLSAL